ncbi:MAG: hypothetical protein IKZ21_00745 [Clostridia bacterium]|nr:hypothetical protein [Clostridia bacterium]
MANTSMKTLLVGLGGTGCEIVARVKRMIGDKDPNVQFVGFDTDVGWEGVEGLQVVHTSREMTVRQYLTDLGNWEDWFPNDPMVMARSMIRGAGQVRFLSRLAFAETCTSRRIGKLEAAIRELRVSRGEVGPNNFRIMIVSSFAGGTGSGMFIQMALFLRKYFRDIYSGDVIIRGLFALPDIFSLTNPSTDQQESMYANAYASLRELNAINQICLSKSKEADEIQMEIPPFFSAKKCRGKAEMKPYDFVFFMDISNERGRILQSPEDYKQLMATATYMQVYSPVSATGDSREDNLIRALIKGDGRNLYGGVGASKIVYPYEDLVKYCGTRATVDSMDEVWTVVDRDFRKADEDNRKLMKMDSTAKPLSRADHFITTMDNVMAEGATKFGFMQKAIVDTSSDGQRVDRVESFLQAVEAYVMGRVEKDEAILTKKNGAELNEDNLKSELVEQVGTHETNLKNYHNTIEERVVQMKSATVQSILPDELDSALATDSDHNIRELLSVDGKVLHPLAVRYLLYSLHKKLSAMKDDESTKAKAARTAILHYQRKGYDVEETKDRVETATEVAGEAKGRRKKEFMWDYVEKAGGQKTRLDRYAHEKMKSEVYSDLLERIKKLIAQYERFFDNLEDIQQILKAEIQVMEEKQHANTGETSVYLCATPEEKKALYKSMGSIDANQPDSPIYGSIYEALYKEAVGTGSGEQKVTMTKSLRKNKNAKKEEEGLSMTELFRQQVVAYNIEELKKVQKDKLDIDVFTALNKDVTHETIGEVIDIANNKALPFLGHSMTRKIGTMDDFESSGMKESSAFSLIFWGIHPEVKEKIAEVMGDTAVANFFVSGDSAIVPQVVSDKEYTRHEISCYQALYCVTLPEIPKFLEVGDGKGIYYENYSKCLEAVLEGVSDAVSPHLDIRWHKRSYLPMISPMKNREDDKRTARALWLAMIYGGLPEETIKGKKQLYASFAVMNPKKATVEEKYRRRELSYGGKGIAITNIYELYKALQLDELAVKQFEEVLTPVMEADVEHGQESVFFQGKRASRFALRMVSKDDPDHNALNVLGRFTSHPKATEEERAIMIQALEELLGEFLEELTEERQKEFRKLICQASRYALPAKGGKKGAKAASNPNRAKSGKGINFEYWDGIEA